MDARSSARLLVGTTSGPPKGPFSSSRPDTTRAEARFRLPSINNRPASLGAESTIVCAGAMDEDKGPPWHISVDQAKAVFGAAVKRTDDAKGGLVFGVARSREDKRPNAPG